MLLFVLLFLFCLDIVLVECEWFTFSTICLILTVTSVHFLKIFNIVDFVKHNYIETGLYCFGYIVAGIIWSFVKWFSFLLKYKENLIERVEKFKKENPDCLEESVRKHLLDRDYIGASEAPTAKKNKGRIIAWMSFWPMSLIGTFLNNPVKRLFTLIYNSISGLYQQMADKVLGPYKNYIK